MAMPRQELCLAPPFEEWEDGELLEDGELVVSYSAMTDDGNEIRGPIPLQGHDRQDHVKLSRRDAISARSSYVQ